MPPVCKNTHYALNYSHDNDVRDLEIGYMIVILIHEKSLKA